MNRNDKPKSLLFPSELELIEWFGYAPRSERCGHMLYEVSDGTGMHLAFSFDAIERSIQTALFRDGFAVCRVVNEGARRIWLDDLSGTRVLRAEFTGDDREISLTIKINPRICVEWTGLLH
jgi:hypothetical protein